MKKLFPLVLLLCAACDDPFGPSFWNARPDTITLHSASRAEYIGLGSVLDITSDPVTPYPIEAASVSGSWDFALTDAGGVLSLVPAGNFEGLGTSRAAIAVIENRAFDEVEEAPSDTARYSSAAVPLRTGVVYVLRSRRASCGFTSGSRYARIQPIEVDATRGIFRFAIVRNPFCDDRALVPPEDD